MPRVTPAVLNLLLINGLMFLAIWLLQPSETVYLLHKTNLLGQHPMVEIEGLQRYLVSTPDGPRYLPSGPDDFRPLQLVTHFFAHESILHFLFNMFALFSVGTAVELAMGSRRFIEFYLFCGLLGGVAIAVLDPSPNPVLGASGAISGVLVGMALYYPRSEMIIFPIPIPIQARWLVAGGFVFSLVMVAVNAPGNVSHFGHLAGMVAALLYFFGRQFLPRR